MSKDKDFMTDRLTKDTGKAFSPSRYSLKSGNDAILSPYATYDLFYEITFKVMQKLGAYEDIGTPEECRKAIEKQTEYQNRIKGLISTIEDICKNSRDRHVDDEHCGLCKYDGAYIGESGDWYNECPGFYKDGCFELSEEFKKKYIDWEE